MGVLNVYSKKKIEMKRLIRQLVKESLTMRINFSFRYYDSDSNDFELQFSMQNSNEGDIYYFGESTITLSNYNNIFDSGLIECFSIDYWDNGNDACEVLLQFILKTLVNNPYELIFEFANARKEYTKIEIESMLTTEIKIINLL